MGSQRHLAWAVALPLLSTRFTLCSMCVRSRVAFHGGFHQPFSPSHMQLHRRPLSMYMCRFPRARRPWRTHVSMLRTDEKHFEKREMSSRAEELHVPVLLEQVLDTFQGNPIRSFIDGTLGLGGHSSAILGQHGDSMKLLLGIDQDPAALQLAGARLAAYDSKIRLARGNFGDLIRLAKENGIQFGTVDGILLDIGTSSMQLDEAERGFSFMRDGPLDMRMDPSAPLTAADIVNDWSEEDISNILWEYGEERKSRVLARKIVAARAEERITTTHQLTKVIGGSRSYNPHRKAGLHPDLQQPFRLLPPPRCPVHKMDVVHDRIQIVKRFTSSTLTFQALRIAVNKELQVLAHALPQALQLLAPKGRLAVITFHSLEDRIVKNFFRDTQGDAPRQHRNKYQPSAAAAAAGGLAGDVGEGGEESEGGVRYEVVTRKPVTATEEEMRSNPRARSAKLRVLQRVQ